MISLPDDVAAVLLDCVQSLTGPADNETIARSIREAYFLEGVLLTAFEAAGTDPSSVERAEVPFLVPGSKSSELP